MGVAPRDDCGTAGVREQTLQQSGEKLYANKMTAGVQEQDSKP